MALSKSRFKISRVPELVRFYFTITADDGVVFSCNNWPSTLTNAVNSGYTNLRKHLRKCVGNDFEDKYAVAVKARRNGLGFEVIEYVAERDLVVFRWIEWVLMRNMPLSEVDNPLTRSLTGINSSEHISSDSPSRYLTFLVPLVETEIAYILPVVFAIMFGGWTDKSTHTVFAVFIYDNRVREVLLGFSPPLDETSYTAESQRDLIAYVLRVYGKSLANVTVLIADDCRTNKATADLLGVALLGCACHKLNLAIKRFIKEQVGADEAIASSRSMMTKATNLKAAAALRELTELVPIINNDTRWSSTYRMIERLF
ncbi:unnamed protein product [Phytophthora fragariaefolia]|uniref:Unnamed protein product n=1 Tax=Phytophthora fragariaefolia TaxID=1490495 RepID=A0A9W6WYK6_9STRA|nr:unnamed protein product [Phytophthora fragariaefolia]